MLRHGNTILGILKLRELTEFVTKNRDYVFESNIRQWMQFKTSVNKGLRDTLQNNPDKFYYYNNGITIVVGDFDELGDNMLNFTCASNCKWCSNIKFSFRSCKKNSQYGRFYDSNNHQSR